MARHFHTEIWLLKKLRTFAPFLLKLSYNSVNTETF